MTRYYCPYCSPGYQIHIKNLNGEMICGHCGDPLLKRPIIKPIQLVALIAASAFLAPLIMMVFSFSKDLREPLHKQKLPSVGVLFISSFV